MHSQEWDGSLDITDMCGKYWNYLTKTSSFNICFLKHCAWIASRGQRHVWHVRHLHAVGVSVRFSLRSITCFIIVVLSVMYWCVDMCCNKSRVTWNVYKRLLIINIVVETSASPLFTTDHIQPEFSPFSLFLDDNKQKQDVHTMREIPHTKTEKNHDLVCKQNEWKQCMYPAKIHAKHASYKYFANQWC